MLSMAFNFYTQTTANLFFLLIILSSFVALLSAQRAPLLARSGKVLQVLLPVMSEFNEFVDCSNDDSLVSGFCIDVFKSALDILIPKPSWTHVNYTCFQPGEKSYDIMIKAMFNEAFFNETLSAAFSVAILNLTESGRLRKLQDAWKLSNFKCPSRVQSMQLDLKSSNGLFILLGTAMLLAVIFMYLHKHLLLPRWVRSYVRVQSNHQQHARDGANFHRFATRWFSARDYLD